MTETTLTTLYIRGTSKTVTIVRIQQITLQHARCSQTDNHFTMTSYTNVKDKDRLEDRQGAVLYETKCCDCQATYISETGRNLSTWLIEHKQVTRNGDVNNHIAEHHIQVKHLF